VAWDDVALGRVEVTGSVLVLDDLQDAAAPLTAVKLAEAGASVRLVTRWPMFGMETIPEVYFIWIQSRLYESGVELTTDHFVKEIAGLSVTLFNVYAPDREIEVDADCVVMATGRRSENDLYHALREQGRSVEMIGDAIAPRTTYEAVYEGHRQARKL
jgi:thioredoxin reductase